MTSSPKAVCDRDVPVLRDRAHKHRRGFHRPFPDGLFQPSDLSLAYGRIAALKSCAQPCGSERQELPHPGQVQEEHARVVVGRPLEHVAWVALLPQCLKVGKDDAVEVEEECVMDRRWQRFVQEHLQIRAEGMVEPVTRMSVRSSRGS